MSTETADIERMARDIFSEASPTREWETAPARRREFCIGMAKHLHALGYKPSIVHACCVEAEAARTTKRACTCTYRDACSNCTETDTAQAGSIEHTEILAYGILGSNGQTYSGTFPPDQYGKAKAILVVQEVNRNLALTESGTSVQPVILTALPQEQTNG